MASVAESDLQPLTATPLQPITNETASTGLTTEPQNDKFYGSIDENLTQNEAQGQMPYIPAPLATALSSVPCFIFLCVLLIIPVLQLAFGATYKHQCPIQPFIPTYLIVSGACSLVGILLVLIVTGTFIWCIAKENVVGSVFGLCCMGCVFVFLAVMSIFLFAWFIAGNVWVFGITKRVVYTPFSPNYCQKTLYDFAFFILILTWVAPLFYCFVTCLCSCFGLNKTETKS